MDIKGLKLNTINLSLKKTSKKIVSFWNGYYQFIFIALLIFFSLLGIYYWYLSLYKSSWNADRITQYSLTQNREINLKEDAYQKVLDETEKMKQDFNADVEPSKDIFKPYDGYQVNNPIQ